MADTPCHPDDVACAMSPTNEVQRVVWPLGTRLASDFGRARQKCLSVPYGELAYVTCPTNEESSWLNEEKTLIG